jgi:hypothetical protein
VRLWTGIQILVEFLCQKYSKQDVCSEWENGLGDFQTPFQICAEEVKHSA